MVRVIRSVPGSIRSLSLATAKDQKKTVRKNLDKAHTVFSNTGWLSTRSRTADYSVVTVYSPAVARNIRQSLTKQSSHWLRLEVRAHNVEADKLIREKDLTLTRCSQKQRQQVKRHSLNWPKFG